MASLRERNNLASKKSYEKALEKHYATDYEHEVIRQYRLSQPGAEVWHWSNVPEDHLYEAGYITDYNKLRLERLMNKRDKTRETNRLKDYGLDGLVRTRCGENKYTYNAIQAKYYLTRQITASDIGTFLASQLMLSVKNNKSKGYLYTTANLQADLAGFIAHPEYPIKYVKHSWKHADKKTATAPIITKQRECDLTLRPYQKEAIERLKDKEGINAIHIPCRMGKTLIAGHILRQRQPDTIIAIAPLKISVKNLQDRLECSLSGYKTLLVDSDADGTTDEIVITKFLEKSGKKIIYSTYKSFVDILAGIFIQENGEGDEDSNSDSQDSEDEEKVKEANAFILVDEVHNAGDEECELINQFQEGLVMSATYPENLSLDINETVYIPFSLGISEGYLVDYSLWLPHLVYKEDGTTAVDVDIPVEFSEYSADVTAKALYLAVVMLKTGSRRCIVYLNSIEECEAFRKIVTTVFEEYHGITVWTGKIDSTVTHKEREELLDEFQNGSDENYHIMTSVRVLDEAVDIPRCDSVFIGSVSEHSSVIRFMQRCMRSSTIDPQNPNKHNSIILWADGWEKCVDALELLRESDPEFIKKVRIASTNYDRQADKEQKELVVSDASKFGEWIAVKSEDLWEKKRQAWAEFYRVNERFPSQKSPNILESNLKRWQLYQRTLYKIKAKCMTPDRVKILEDTPGWVWKKIDPWEEHRQAWLKFKREYGRNPVITSDDLAEKRLGQWQSRQRFAYNIKKKCLTPDKIKTLNNDTPGWSWDESDIWEENRLALIKFMKDFNKSPSQSSKNVEEKRLGLWIQGQRRQYKAKQKCMTPERIKKLETETPGWRWKDPDNWEEILQEWIEFRKEHGYTPSSNSKNILEKKLGNWRTSQRSAYKNNKLSSERIKILDKTHGWTWEEADSWEEQLKKLIDFIETNKRYPIQTTKDKKEGGIAVWYHKQRINYKNKEPSLTTAKITILENLPDWKWEESDTWEEKRRQWIQYVKKHKKYPSNTSTDAIERPLGQWQAQQRYNYRTKNTCMTPERIRLLEEAPNWKWGDKK